MFHDKFSYYWCIQVSTEEYFVIFVMVNTHLWQLLHSQNFVFFRILQQSSFISFVVGSIEPRTQHLSNQAGLLLTITCDDSQPCAKI